ncbi:MAG: hypothetical protein FJ098_03015 [Deltaproteobacteria bacterium]|nr:hypothetical protein [Deltaproteobacteria bacterium]
MLLEQGLLQSGLPREGVRTVTAEMPKARRERLAQEIREGTSPVRIIVATMVWSTGVDIPGIRWVLWAGGGQAPIGLIQSCGRGARLASGKGSFDFIDVADQDENMDRRDQHLGSVLPRNGSRSSETDFLNHVLQQDRRPERHLPQPMARSSMLPVLPLSHTPNHGQGPFQKRNPLGNPFEPWNGGHIIHMSQLINWILLPFLVIFALLCLKNP